MTDKYIPTLGEYAEVIHWLVGHPNEEVPSEMRRVFNDAINRAELRHFAADLLKLDCIPEHQVRGLEALWTDFDEAATFETGDP